MKPSIKHTQKELQIAKQKSVKLYLGVKCYFLFFSWNKYIYLSVFKKIIPLVEYLSLFILHLHQGICPFPTILQHVTISHKKRGHQQRIYRFSSFEIHPSLILQKLRSKMLFQRLIKGSNFCLCLPTPTLLSTSILVFLLGSYDLSHIATKRKAALETVRGLCWENLL